MQLVLKVAARCNLNCSYCYVFNKADSMWKHRPAIMSDEIFEATLERIRRHCSLSGQKHLNILFHGGEPCLLGTKQFDAWCSRARHVLNGIVHLRFDIQTNGTLLDEDWAKVFREHNVGVGVSVDGPKQNHDVFRVDHAGRGSYDAVERGLKRLQESGIQFGILCVIPLGAEPLSVHRHLLGLGCSRIGYLMPHFTHDSIGPIRERYGPTPCADFLIPVFDDWWFNGTLDVRIRELWNIARVILGGTSEEEGIGNIPPLYVFVETDGEMEGLDCLRVCKEGITRTNLNVWNADFHEILETESMHKTAIFEGMPLSQVCRNCPEGDTCAGGYIPDRYSSERGFDNPSVWCADLLKLFTHLRTRLGVTVEETYLRRRSLQHGAATVCASYN